MPQPVTVKKLKLKWFYEDLQDLLELTPKKDILFIIGDGNTEEGSQEIPGITGKFGLGVQNETVSSVAQSCQTLCNPMDCNIPGFPVHHQLPEFTQIHVH